MVPPHHPQNVSLGFEGEWQIVFAVTFARARDLGIWGGSKVLCVYVPPGGHWFPNVSGANDDCRIVGFSENMSLGPPKVGPQPKEAILVFFFPFHFSAILQ